MQKTKDIINYKALSEAVTGSSRKITKNKTADKYAGDIDQLIDMIDVWLKWTRAKHNT